LAAEIAEGQILFYAEVVGLVIYKIVFIKIYRFLSLNRKLKVKKTNLAEISSRNNLPGPWLLASAFPPWLS
jgi:hypothetical protein